ncbi:YhgE/Pip domain-containing protein [Clostridium rectalis]|uniref:YhgE/Pip domain-containing protein n=1 Tax=Clostridium rectalis TaxID=2040295 RepID=UPI000F63E4D0|nr:YhgE/Pip domain-containing protein [Clostridium rectalis]
MKNIFCIYKRDILNILSNWVATVIVLGLIILPSLYAWFNIRSSWDPYGNTRGIKVAIVNKDKGSSYKDISVNVGEELVKSLNENKNIGWVFVDEEDAKNGVKYGKYYASITITEEFSYKLLSIVREKIEKPDIIYSVNEKRNAVAPKITEKGVTSIQNEISKNFVKTVNNVIFDIFNKLGIQIEEEKPKIKELINIILYINNKIPEINKSIDELYNGAITLESFIKKVNKDMPLIEDTINKGSNICKSGKEFLLKATEGIQKSVPYIKEDMIIIREIISSTESIISQSVNIIGTNTIRARELLIKANDRLNNASDKIDNIKRFLKSFDKNSNNKLISNLVDKMTKVNDKLSREMQLINLILQSIDKGEKPSIDLLNELMKRAEEATTILDNIIENFDSKIAPAINSVTNEIVILAGNITKILDDANKDLPKIKELLNKAYKGTIKGKEDIQLIKKSLPKIEKSIGSIADKVKTLNDNKQLNEIIKILKNDAGRESEFLANPVNIKENRMFPIPNYGSSMSPFFTTLSLWVGALILVSILSVNLHNVENTKLYQVYFGRYLTFMTIAIFQAIIVSMGDIFILKIYAAHKGVFILYSIFISIVFSMIVYTLVSVFGNVGKALAVILLVLQISASGGTFPIEVTPRFFQIINPFLPFTYAIGTMREAVGGIVPELLIFNSCMLLVYFFLSILIALLLKKRFNKMNEKFVRKFKDSGLVEE